MADWPFAPLLLPHFFLCAREAGSLTVYECPNADACIGGSDSTSYCAEGFKGPRELTVKLKFKLALHLTGRL